MKIKKQFLFRILFYTLGIFILYCEKANPTKKYEADITEFAVPRDALPFYKGKDLLPFWIEKKEMVQTRGFRYISKFQTTNQLNKQITNADMEGNLSIVSFFFTHCSGICPRIIGNLQKVQREYSKEKGIKLFSFSVTPDLDTPEVLEAYAGQRGIENTQWNLLTGSKSEIYKMARESFNADTITPAEKKKGIGKNDFLHSENVYLLDKNLYLRGIYNGRNPVSISELIQDIKTLRMEN